MTSAGKDADTTVFSADDLSGLSAGWSMELVRMATQIKVVAGTTEDEFLIIGSRLQDFYQRGIEISSLASELVGEVAGEHISGAINGLSEMLDQMVHYVNNAQRELERSSSTLRETLGLLDHVAGPLSGFKKVNKVLRMLGISTKIESARLGKGTAGFDTLAIDVGNLAVQVNDKAVVILAHKDELAKAIEKTLIGVLNSGERQHDQVIGILDKIRNSLAALTAINTRCTSAISEISAVSEEVPHNIGEVVMSMQAHDMVRQQIEHVEQALSDLGGRLSAGDAGADEAAGICELQTAQLRHADCELDTAVQTIIGNLKEIARKQSRLSEETSGIAGIANQTEGGFFTEIQRDISVVSTTLLESSKVNQSLCIAMGVVANTVGEIASFVGDIETIGEEIKLIALNAQIKAAYTGDDGAALGVLAEAIQRLSIDAIDHTIAVSGTLQAISKVTDSLNDEVSGETSTLEMEVHGMVASLTGLLEVLRTVNETLHSSLSRMDEVVTILSSEIDQITNGITVHRKVSQVLEAAVLGLGGIITEARRVAPGSMQSVNIEELASRYTMHSERKIHESLFEEVVATRHKEPTPSDEGLGGNVELF